ncbi:ATP-dependent 6-phosphofructokinase [Sulfurovum sp. TSL6]|uniref:6-phosphofructokinase n=1 Tax=Sulfurovum sp. TSL6 TaxID=2826995 RepID=UPI001CC54515|nr:6-phosphofructokinase [Sulfurovum sp. TSL6]GIU00265.1 ATP-dependent 6-phosphofructokinase [Sulfurovum sp. TSL6]
MKNIAILCSGGDVSGMNAALKRFVEYSIGKGLTPYFVNNGFEGLIDNNIYKAGYRDVAGIISRGGTKIRSSRSKRFMEQSYRKQALDNLKAHNIGYLVVLGGDGSFKGMQALSDESEGLSFAGIPATIDNDIAGTEYCLGVDTALNVIKYAIDSIRDTASSFSRAFVIEAMGRECGYLALVSALTSGAEMCLIPEIPYELNDYKSCFKKQIQEGREYFIAVVSEAMKNSEDVAQWFEEEIGIESRITVLGHMQRGGNPTVYDRLMAFDFVTQAIDGLLEGNKSSVICYNKSGFNHKDIEDVAFKKYEINAELLKLGMEFGCHI